MASLPRGTVTFLFTDIEGSTRLLQELGAEQYAAALDDHRRALREAFARHGGVEVDTQGDAFLVAFRRASDALAAAREGQLALVPTRVRVRMGIHTGEPLVTPEGYVGMDVHKGARIAAAAHGGQVLVSEQTASLVGADGLRDLGVLRLKDLTRPEHVFQLCAPGLSAEFLPLRTLDARPHNLPVQPTVLIGREREIREITERLRRREERLLTLTGPGGTGKTRLALQAAADLVDSFADGTYFVNLAPISDPALVPSAIARVLGVREAPERLLTEALPEYLREKQLLLLLDNFEQVMEAAPLVAELLAAAPGVEGRDTSRPPLHLRGEHDYTVPPLALPDVRALPPLERLMQYAAVRLFIERAQAAKADFEVTHENAPTVAEICHRLDGLPLAVELAAARIRILPPQAMLSRLQSRLKLLTGGARDLPARQQTLRGAIEWSYELLGEEEKMLFRRLAVFFGGRTLEAIESICNAEGELDVLEGVSSLVDKSLLKQEESAGGEPRFVMLETIHEYAREKLQESAEAQEIGRRHAEFFLALAEEAEPQLRGAAQGQWRARLEAEHDNLRAALGRMLEQGEGELAARLAGSLWRFWSARGHYREGRRWLAEVLAAEGLSPRTRAKALLGAGVLAWRQGERDAAQPLFEESLALWDELGEARGIARTLNGLGILASERGDIAGAEALFEEALDRWREIGETRMAAVVLSNLGFTAWNKQEYARAAALYQEGLALARQAQDLALVSVALLSLGDLARRQGDLQEARAWLRESLRIAWDTGHLELATDGLAALAQVIAAARAGERAARLFGAVEARFAAIGSHVQGPNRPEYDRDLAAARAQLDEATWERLYREGAALTLEEAITYALEEEG